MCSAYRLRKDIHKPILDSERTLHLLAQTTSRLAFSRQITSLNFTSFDDIPR